MPLDTIVPNRVLEAHQRVLDDPEIVPLVAPSLSECLDAIVPMPALDGVLLAQAGPEGEHPLRRAPVSAQRMPSESARDWCSSSTLSLKCDPPDGRSCL